ncbi:hypothetical protein CK203_064336 [Vitis vinifera]|uniref:Uncharacterized protein n=1 Tax=Vitis vinifera TaxID=29760 RepID=A0A438GWI4_VITVI|nr:hypothetical protein CK203_064336 [Vitis vinifera]
MTLELNIFYMSKKLITPEEEEGPEEVCIIDTLVEERCNKNMQDKLNESLGDLEEGLPEPSDVLGTLQGWRMREEIIPLFNKEKAQEVVKEEAPKLNLKPLPIELKYTYLEAYDAEPRAPAGPKHPEIPQLECLEEPQPVEIPLAMRALASAVAFVGPMPEVASFAPLATPGTPPIVPATFEPPPPFESRIAITLSEFRGLCHTLQTLTASQSILTQQMAAIRAHQDQLIATQTQHTVILRQHLGILSLPKHAIPIPLEPTDPSQGPPLAEQTIPPEETTTREIEASIPSIPTSTAEPSSPHDPPTTI